MPYSDRLFLKRQRRIDMAKRARQINSYFNHLGESLGSMIPPQVTSVARKPLSIGFEEISVDKIVAHPTHHKVDEVDEPAEA